MNTRVYEQDHWRKKIQSWFKLNEVSKQIQRTFLFDLHA